MRRGFFTVRLSTFETWSPFRGARQEGKSLNQWILERLEQTG